MKIVHLGKYYPPAFGGIEAHTQTLARSQAALGADVNVRTLEGEQSVRIAEGTQSNSLFKLKGKGMPVLGGRGRGDLYVAVKVITPTNLSKEQRRVLEECRATGARQRRLLGRAGRDDPGLWPGLGLWFQLSKVTNR